MCQYICFENINKPTLFSSFFSGNFDDTLLYSRTQTHSFVERPSSAHILKNGTTPSHFQEFVPLYILCDYSTGGSFMGFSSPEMISFASVFSQMIRTAVSRSPNSGLYSVSTSPWGVTTITASSVTIISTTL